MAENFGLRVSPAEHPQTAGIRVVVFESTRMGCELLSRALEASEYGLRVVDTVFSAAENEAPRQSFPIQDEPEGEGSFQYKMSLERMAC